MIVASCLWSSLHMTFESVRGESRLGSRLVDCFCCCAGDSDTRAPPTGCGCYRLSCTAIWSDISCSGEQTSSAAALPLQGVCEASQGCPAAGHSNQHLHRIPGSSQGEESPIREVSSFRRWCVKSWEGFFCPHSFPAHPTEPCGEQVGVRRTGAI